LKTGQDVLDEEKSYNPYIVNRALSQHYDCIMVANAMNMVPHTDKRMQYDYLLHSVRKYKRPFKGWAKRKDDENMETVKEYYYCTNEKAKEILSILTQEQIDQLKERLDPGGIQKTK
jgi:hypothetical protein